jgi:hypothetical protein
VIELSQLSPELIFASGGVLALLLLLGMPWWGRQRRLQLQQQPFPAPWRRMLLQWPLYRHLPPPLQQRLQRLVQVFIAEKPIIGCQGLVVTDEMRVLIAAQACLMVLQLQFQPGTVPFPELRQVLLYPSAFVVTATHAQPGGVVSSGKEVRLGESWQHGQVVLSWPDVQAGVFSGVWPQLVAEPPHLSTSNLVIHEFAHQLDQETGPANGAPILRVGQSAQTWRHIFKQEYEKLQWLVDAGEASLIDPYGASAPEEFFAVASETFFMQPQAMHEQHPALFAQLAQYYGLNPTAWM